MSATINVVCYRNKRLSNGESPLMIRVCMDRKSKYKSLGISINPKYWDFDKNRPKVNYLHKKMIFSSFFLILIIGGNLNIFLIS